MDRQAAYKLFVKDLISGKLEKTGDGIPYVSLWGLKIFKVHLTGTVVAKYKKKDTEYSSVVLDDGTACIRVKGFGEKSEDVGNLEVGDIVDVIGRIRFDGDEISINAEIVRKIEDVNLELLRVLERIVLREKFKKEKEEKERELEEIEPEIEEVV